MNAKKCKALRQSLRASGIDPTQVRLKVMKVGYQRRKLDPLCGRAVYQRTKRSAA